MRAAAALIALAAAWYYWRGPAFASSSAGGGESGAAGRGAAPGEGDASIFNPLPLPPMNASTNSSIVIPAGAPRGIRNNNPGNIEIGTDKWQGMAPQQTDGRFLQFVAPVWGMRAMARVLMNYQRLHGISTIRGIIERWAPPKKKGVVENYTEAYIAAVAAFMGQGSNVAMDLYARPELLSRLMRAIVTHENGASWRDFYPESLYQQGITLAR